MVNYQLGKVYKIVCRITGEIYVGSTCETTLARRLAAHRNHCKDYHEKNRGTNVSSFQIILRGDYYIDLLEAYPCNSSDELHKKEREYFDNIECINKIRPYLFKEEMKAERIIYDEIHKDVIREQQKKYIDEHRERINECSRLSYHKNKKVPTEEEIEAKRIKKQEMAEHMRIIMKKIRKEKYEAKLAENPNYAEELKAKQIELQKGYKLKYHLKKQAEKKAKEEEKDTI